MAGAPAAEPAGEGATSDIDTLRREMEAMRARLDRLSGE
jgi:hypothetical protein